MNHFQFCPRLLLAVRATPWRLTAYYTEIHAELPLVYIGDMILFQTAFALNLLSQWLDVISDMVYS